MERVILSGDEAVARGAYEGGCTVAAAYPGTPSTEILEDVVKYKDKIYCEWSCNEKTAAELVAGASIGGARSLVTMKHVGMNVATDPIFTMGYAGVNGGMVIVSADDPGCHSSQNEQDNRLYAPHAKIGMLEPSDSQECKDFTIAAFELSERFDVPVLIRMTTRVCHAKSIVELGERNEVGVKKYERNTGKYAMLPAVARKRHIIREQLLAEMEEYSNDCPFNRVEKKEGNTIGIITSGVSYEHAKEVFGDDADFLKLGLTYPLPHKLIKEFAQNYETLYVIEENDPYLEKEVKALGFTNAVGKDKLPICDELNAQIVREALCDAPKPDLYEGFQVPGRAPALCAGCPHRGFFYALSKRLNKVVPVGDIGCYALGSAAPLNGFDYSICMGAGISSLIGLSKALELQGDSRKALGMVGDSTFFHSGLTSLINAVASQANIVACILDNSITAMTGHQDNPGTAKNLMGEPTPVVDIVSLVKAAGIDEDHLAIVDPIDLKTVEEALDKAIASDGVYVIITKRPCVMIKEVQRANAGKHCVINKDKCVGCKMCMKVACPAISLKDGRPVIDASSCTQCGLCSEMCKLGAIEKVGA